MSLKSTDSKYSLRFYFKTHVSDEIGNWFKVKGMDQCTVSSISMTKYFVTQNWKEIIIAFPYNPLKVQKISQLASQVKLNILIESEESLMHASKHIESTIECFIKVDVGTHCTEIDPRNKAGIQKLVNPPFGKIKFEGFLAHASHTYDCNNNESIKWIFEKLFLIKKDTNEKNSKSFGKIVRLSDNGWNTEIIGHLARLPQEHDIIKLREEEITHVTIGDIVGVISAHSCLTANLQGHYVLTTGECIEKRTKN